MTDQAGVRPLAAGWAASLLLHAAVLLGGSLFLVQSPQFAVASGKISTEVELVAAPEPPPEVAATPQPAPPPPVPAPPQEQPIAPPSVTPLPSVSPTPEAARPAPATPSHPKALHHPSTHTPTRQLPSRTDRGVVQAQPDYLANPPPVYPESSRAAGEHGVALLRVTVSESGAPSRVTLIHSSGHPRLDAAALKAVRTWKFRPASAGGLRVSCEVNIPIRFDLN